MKFEPQKQHQWLQQLVGEWTYETEASTDPGPGGAGRGRETVRALGPLWIVAEGRGPMPEGGEGLTLMTLGYDPQQERFVGSWVGSMMPMIWVYEGSLEAGGRILNLDSEGPAMSGVGCGKYRDVIEIVSDDHRIFSGNALQPDGSWRPLMRTHYRRVR
ncbi:Protein of unknown function [Nannocystis exedens]|uniref:DUF1579 domain-containing protein n=1 Tax=Nannocystis exedens TaxID=54 RepID=A0A1I2ATA0_9BACT|nr:DUF1579 domain-containing protein [Nannocystis exedens]PCC74250.1 hypothetical protein NAEX_07339 [Nannocystis exedens]SFE46947.1 Protein of unknown function [Nannocystis exedens]